MRFSKKWFIIGVSIIGLATIGWGVYRFFIPSYSRNEHITIEHSQKFAPVAPEIFEEKASATSNFLALPLTDEDKAKIHALLEPLASWSLVTLGFKQGEVKSRGYAIGHIHILRCLGYVFSDQVLKRYMIKIRNRQKVWQPFSAGFVNSLRKKYAEGEIQPYLEGFALQVHVDFKQLALYAESGQWNQFLLSLF